MKPHPRIRKTIKWGGAVVTVLLVVVWIGSGWWYAFFDLSWPPGFQLQTPYGQLAVVHDKTHLPGNPYPLRMWVQHQFQLTMWGLDLQRTPRVDILVFPLWMPPAAGLGLTCVALRLDTLARRRARLNLCPKCNYDRTGLASRAKCPECGAPHAPGTPAVSS